MDLKSTLKRVSSALAVVGFTLLTLNTTAQSTSCKDERVIWLETFGQGTGSTTHPNVINLGYEPTGQLYREGTYRVVTNVQQKPDWHNATDHTGNTDGRMLVINGQAEKFFQKTINDASGFAEGTYSVGMYIMNANQIGVCAPNPLLPVIHITVEYQDGSGNWVALGGSPFVAAPTPQTATPTWVEVGSFFQLPDLGASAPNNIRITIGDGTQGGCGNDFAVDDMKFALCPEGGPAPVTFMDITAKQKGSGVAVDWSTSQEINNDRFEVERSADGNTGWQTIATVAGAGNSQLEHRYSSFDARPLAGINYYRVKQVDKDGKSSYSRTVNAKVDNAATRVSVVGNPFVSNFVVKFNGAAQEVSARLVDITGKQVARETWSVANGESSKQFTNVAGLQNGIYILTVQSKSGELLFNGKVMKQ